jgi:septal ring factor EnvC (AmiA/AmiB activator)
MMRAYFALAPPRPANSLIGHVAALLEEIDRMGRVARDSRASEKELDSQVKTLEQDLAEAGQRQAAAKKREQELLAQIKTLQQQIDQLQKLDLEIERRRRSVR